jgi:hypothetical protein
MRNRCWVWALLIVFATATACSGNEDELHAQIDQLQSQVSTLQDQNSTLTSSRASLRSRLAEANDELESTRACLLTTRGAALVLTRTVADLSKSTSQIRGPHFKATACTGVLSTVTNTYLANAVVSTNQTIRSIEQDRKPSPSPTPCSGSGSNYSPCLPKAGDYDCAGGGGDGPNYVYGTVRVVGVDIYDLDSDSDGYGCD